jgi:hypothetical protein
MMSKKKTPKNKTSEKDISKSKKAMPKQLQGAKAAEKGCGRLVGSCGGDHDGTVSIKGTCVCGRKFLKSCSQSNCSGVTWYC